MAREATPAAQEDDGRAIRAPSLDLRHLRAFLHVADAGSIGRAAQQLNVTQPALSRLIRGFEENLRATLFDRHTHGMQLTDAGRTLLPRARMLIAEAAQAEEELAASAGLGRGTIRVGAVSSVVHAHLSRALVDVLRERPGFHVQILEGNSDELLDALTGRFVDLIVAPELSHRRDISVIGPSGEIDLGAIVAAATHPLAQRERPQAADLAGARWVMPPLPAPSRLWLDDACIRQGLPPITVAVESRSTAALKTLVAEGDHLSFLPRAIFALEERSGILRAIEVPGFEFEHRFLIYRRSSGLLPMPAQLLLAALRQRSRTALSIRGNPDAASR